MIGLVGALFSPAAGAAALAGAGAVAFNFWALTALAGYFFSVVGRKRTVIALLFLLHVGIVPAALITVFVMVPGAAVPAALGALGEATAGPFLLAALALAYR